VIIYHEIKTKIINITTFYIIILSLFQGNNILSYKDQIASLSPNCIKGGVYNLPVSKGYHDWENPEQCVKRLLRLASY
jgi:hypothetical protein